MKLYHTGPSEIREPDIHVGRRNADFGPGFYLTPDLEFARRWASEDAVVNEYELDEEGLAIHRFSRGADWFSYIFHNRRARDGLTADVIIGPIANDTIFDTVGIITSGYLKSEDALKLLMIGPIYTQVAIKTEKAASQLRFIASEKIERIADEQLRREQDAYWQAFAKEVDNIMKDENAAAPCGINYN